MQNKTERINNKTEALSFIEKKLSEIYFTNAWFISTHGINLTFTSYPTQLDLSKKLPDVLYFYNKKIHLLMSYNKKTNEFCLSDKNIWSKLEKDFELNDENIKFLIKSVLEKIFKSRIEKINKGRWI